MAKGGQGPKLAIAAVFFILAGGVIAWQMGVFGGGGATPTPERKAQSEEVRKKVESGELKKQPALQTEPQ